MSSPTESRNWPALLFGALTAIVILGTAIIARATPESVLDISIHDTYYVMPTWVAPLPLVMVCVFFTACYLLFHRATGRRLSMRMGVVHFGCTLLGSTALLLPTLQMYDRYNTAPRQYYSYSEVPMTDDVIDLVSILDVAASVILFGQLVFVANIIRTMFNNNRQAA